MAALQISLLFPLTAPQWRWRRARKKQSTIHCPTLYAFNTLVMCLYFFYYSRSHSLDLMYAWTGICHGNGITFLCRFSLYHNKNQIFGKLPAETLGHSFGSVIGQLGLGREAGVCVYLEISAYYWGGWEYRMRRRKGNCDTNAKEK